MKLLQVQHCQLHPFPSHLCANQVTWQDTPLEILPSAGSMAGSCAPLWAFASCVNDRNDPFRSAVVPLAVEASLALGLASPHNQWPNAVGVTFSSQAAEIWGTLCAWCWVQLSLVHLGMCAGVAPFAAEEKLLEKSRNVSMVLRKL